MTGLTLLVTLQCLQVFITVVRCYIPRLPTCTRFTPVRALSTLPLYAPRACPPTSHVTEVTFSELVTRLGQDRHSERITTACSVGSKDQV